MHPPNPQLLAVCACWHDASTIACPQHTSNQLPRNACSTLRFRVCQPFCKILHLHSQTHRYIMCHKMRKLYSSGSQPTPFSHKIKDAMQLARRCLHMSMWQAHTLQNITNQRQLTQFCTSVGTSLALVLASSMHPQEVPADSCYGALCLVTCERTYSCANLQPPAFPFPSKRTVVTVKQGIPSSWGLQASKPYS